MENVADTSSWIDEPRVLAVLAEPPEVVPGESAQYRLVVASPQGPVDTGQASWAFCRTPRSLAENGAVSRLCAESAEQPIPGTAQTVTVAVPSDACARFGPETSAGLRPTDPDSTGGYYQPVRAESSTDVTVLRHRIRCALANAPIDVAQDYARRYQLNRAPVPGEPVLRFPGGTNAVTRVAPGARLELVFPVLEGSERFVAFDPARTALIERTENLDVAWFATDGELAHARTSLPAVTDLATNQWRAPDRETAVWFWVLLRDDRGASAVVTLRTEVVMSLARTEREQSPSGQEGDARR